MDKFLYLVRVYFRRAFLHFANRQWKDSERLDEYLQILSDIPLSPRNNKIPNGMRYHVIDIYVDELEEVQGPNESDMPVESLLKPLRRLRKESLTKPVRDRAEETLQDDRVKAWLGEEAGVDDAKAPEEEEEEEQEEQEDGHEWGGFDE
jgi:ribosomal RNA-processing protein 1